MTERPEGIRKGRKPSARSRSCFIDLKTYKKEWCGVDGLCRVSLNPRTVIGPLG